ncbi:MAG TPA: LamG domain-containing protein [Kofleriaceae bacterium]|nr:LamG domain-containing protein [Kofleriaceae bacterium]
MTRRLRSAGLALAVFSCAACGDNHGGGGGDPIDAAGSDPDGRHPDGAPGDDGGPEPDGAPASRLVLHYAFEDSGTTVTDQSGRAKDGTLSDASAWTAAGRDGRGLALAGGNPATQFVSLPAGALTDVDDFTIAVWVNVAENTPWTRIYDIGNGQPDPANRFMFLTVSGFAGSTPVGLHSTSYGGSGANEIMLSADASLPTGVWKHVALTGSGGSRQLYVDGFRVATITGGADVPPLEMEPVAPNSWLGKSRFPDPGFHGTLDEFRVYDEVLTEAEIQALAWPGTDYSAWHFDEGTGQVAADASDRAVPTALTQGVGWTTGRAGSAIDLPGTGDAHVSLATSPLAGCTDQLTVAAWAKVDTLTNWSRIFDFGTSNQRFIYLAPTDGAGMHFAMVSPSGLFDLVAPAPFPGDGTWHHVAVTMDAADRVTLYVDGAAVASATNADVPPSDFTATTENWLGRSRFPDPYLDGAIDELRIACRAYTADEIKLLARP